MTALRDSESIWLREQRYVRSSTIESMIKFNKYPRHIFNRDRNGKIEQNDDNYAVDIFHKSLQKERSDNELSNEQEKEIIAEVEFRQI
jgi:hypothetical protein